jgi:regulator of RNase E activity RraA
MEWLPRRPVFVSADPVLVERLAAIPVAEMSDTLDAAGLPGRILSPSLRPLTGAVRIAGPALCLNGEPSGEAGLPIRSVDAAIAPGAIVIVGPGGTCSRALVGGNMIAGWTHRGMRGLLVDGMVRDIAGYPALPVFARGSNPQNCRGHWRFTGAGHPLTLPGREGVEVPVAPRDWILADADGIAVLPGFWLTQLVEDAEEVGRIERRMRRAIDAGADRQTVYETHLRFAHVRRAG